MRRGWVKSTLSETCDMYQPKTITSNEMIPDGPYPVFGANGAIGRYDKFNHEDPQLLITCRGATCGSVNVSEPMSWITGNAMVVRPKSDNLDLRFLEYMFRGGIDITPAITGAAQPQITRTNLNPIEIRYPLDSEEQQRIVTLLDEAFDGIATARAHAEKNLQNARAIFESHLQSVFDEAAEIGEWVVLADLATEITDGDHMPPPKSMRGVPFITIGNIAKDTRTVDFSDTFMVSRLYFDGLKPNKKPQVGDVLYTVTGSYGVPVLITESREFCFQRHIGLIRPRPGVSSEWLYYLLMSPQVFKQANEGATGTAQKTVSLKVLRGYKVPKVPMETQLSTVAKLDSLFEETQRLESTYQQKLTALEELKKSLLYRAFSGNL
ncbi:MAG: restriction endonuclease subunit S [Rhodoferax sp.]|nr:restriction endonuclease subunit S [Rhodoferax sp.]